MPNLKKLNQGQHLVCQTNWRSILKIPMSMTSIGSQSLLLQLVENNPGFCSPLCKQIQCSCRLEVALPQVGEGQEGWIAKRKIQFIWFLQTCTALDVFHVLQPLCWLLFMWALSLRVQWGRHTCCFSTIIDMHKFVTFCSFSKSWWLWTIMWIQDSYYCWFKKCWLRVWMWCRDTQPTWKHTEQ